MIYKCSFNNGLKLDIAGEERLCLCACQWHGDPLYHIEGRDLFRDNVWIRQLPSDTIVRLWDEANGDPVLGQLLEDNL